VRVELLAEAERELGQEIGYHEAIEPGLGQRLKTEIRQAIEWIRRNPEVPPLRAKGYRRVNLRVFPYYIAYLIWADTIWILAVAHCRRRPEFWVRRKGRIS
jgi:hypothetical protein